MTCYLVGGCCYGYWSTWDGHFVHSVPYYEQLVAELNLAILKAHFSRMEAMEKRGGVVDDPTADARKRTSWRGCFWRVDPQESDDDDGIGASGTSVVNVCRRGPPAAHGT